MLLFNFVTPLPLADAWPNAKRSNPWEMCAHLCIQALDQSTCGIDKSPGHFGQLFCALCLRVNARRSTRIVGLLLLLLLLGFCRVYEGYLARHFENRTRVSI